MIHHYIINLECISLVLGVLLIKPILSLAEACLCINYGGSGNHFVKVQVGTISRRDMSCHGMLYDYTDHWNTPYPPHDLEVKHNGFYGFPPVGLAYLCTYFLAPIGVGV